MSNLEDIYTEWQNNPQFREAFTQDPKKALETWGYKVTTEEWVKILQFKKGNEKLDDRINK